MRSYSNYAYPWGEEQVEEWNFYIWQKAQEKRYKKKKIALIIILLLSLILDGMLVYYDFFI